MFKTFKNDFPASIVVFFVALPLCLGIALASDAPPLSGLIAGIIGGMIVAPISGSKIGVSGPAAGLAAIVAVAVSELGSFEIFLTAVVLAGVFQLIFGLLRLGIIGYFFPNSVIVGMLSGIGIIIILKQIPHLFGYDIEPMVINSYPESSGATTFSTLTQITDNITIGSMLIGLIGLAIILLWDNILVTKHKIFKIVQGPIIAVLAGTLLKIVFDNSSLKIDESHLVQIPIATTSDEFFGFFTFPDFSQILNPTVWTIAFTIALVASLETLLSVEATDKLDPDKNITPTNRELFAQGIGNMTSGLIGGLPITQVIVRSSANIQSKAKTKTSAILHGLYLLMALVLIGNILNHVPNAVLASILIVVGYKLAKPSLFKTMWHRGWTQFLPFVVTILVILFKNLLWGIFIGLSMGIFVVLLKSFQNSMFLHKQESDDKQTVKIVLAEEVTFLNKATIQKTLNEISEHSNLFLDISKTKHLDYDVIEILEDFAVQSKNKNIDVTLNLSHGVFHNPESYVELLKPQNNKKRVKID
jgi:MFS superfamily sulfate permease-like transporter